jgi:Family of unknown function (DUF6193)
LGKVILGMLSLGPNASVEDESSSVYSASLRKHDRTASVEVASDVRMFFAGFAWKGISVASFSTADLHELSRGVQFWVVDQLTPGEMQQQLPGLSSNELLLEIDSARLVTARWNVLLSSDPWLRHELKALISAASKRPVLRQLFPVVSIGTYLSFSRTVAYPFSIAGACAAWMGKDRYAALGPDRKILSEGTINEVLDAVERAVPPMTGPAILGTAADLKRE